ncbi:hypothetical protein DL96DRAFT_1765502 [Flagelloscypha sp. PMI_526]|nr:hypothetical protein DL96DRAFT_1765502 [Flagelloscypha sp. PMI_526]
MFWETSFPTAALESISAPLSHPAKPPISPRTFDYVVIGGGVAGCVLARRLSERKNCSVLLVDGGLSQQPTTHSLTETMWTRPIPAEFEAYKERWGLEGWTWNDVVQAFKRSETSLSPENMNACFRGRSGPVQTRMVQDVQFESLRKAYQVAQTFNIPEIERANDPFTPHTHIGFVDLTIDSSGSPVVASTAYLPAKFAYEHKEHLTVLSQTIVTSLDIRTDGNGKFFVAGVFLEKETSSEGPAASDFRKYYVAARKEVICTAGAVSTPQLLQLSGLGPRTLLSSLSIPTRVDLPVGQTFQDHFNVPLIWSCPLSDSSLSTTSNPLAGLRGFFKSVLGTSTQLGPSPQSVVWISSRLINEKTGTVKDQSSGNLLDPFEEENIPDLQFMLLASTISQIPVTGQLPVLPPATGGFTILVSLIRPICSGSVSITNVSTLKKGVGLALHMGREMQKMGYPMSDFQVPRSDADSDLEGFVKAKVGRGNQLASSCPMRSETDGGVVDEKLRVKGVKKLRVADASVFPRVPAAQLMAPTVMIAEKCVEFLKEGAM